MKPHFPIALGAGLIAAALFAFATSGPMAMRLVLVALLAVPISLAGFACNAATAAMAALIGTAAVAIVFKPSGVLLFALVAAPVSWLVYLSLLRREDENGAEWYPVGRILLAAEIIAASLVAGALALFTEDLETLKASIRSSVETTIKGGMVGLPNPSEITAEQIAQVADLMTILLPAVGATMVLLGLIGVLWLGARVARATGTLVRPWPDIAAFSFPAGTPLLLVAAFLATVLLEGKPQLLALSYAGAFYAGYVILGLAIAHYVSRGLSVRTPLLVALYVILFVANSGVSLLLAMIGLLDSLYPLRRTGGDPPFNPRTGPGA